jgi:hypothetical protein
MKRSVFVALLLILSCVTRAEANHISATGSVEITNPKDSTFLSIPKNISWSPEAKKLATRSIALLRQEIRQELNSLKSDGAVTIEKVYESTIPPQYSNWKDYVPDIRSYKLKGYDLEGNLVRTTSSNPIQRNLISSWLVTLENDTCSFSTFNIFDFRTWFTKACSITKPKEESYLRAALRGYISMTDNPQSISAWAIANIRDCFAQNGSYSIQKGMFTCPANAKYYSGQVIPIDLYFKSDLGGYEITLNKSAQKAKVKLLPPDFYALASQVKLYPGTSTLVFGLT